MATTLDKMMQRLTKERQAKVEARAKELIAQEMTLRELRQARDLTQEDIAKLLGIGQDSISRLEQRKNLTLSTLTGYITAIGGNLRLTVDFPDRPPVALSWFADEQEK